MLEHSNAVEEVSPGSPSFRVMSASSESTPLLPPLQPWHLLEPEDFKDALKRMCDLSCGRGHPELPLAPRVDVDANEPYAEKAIRMLLFCLRMSDHDATDGAAVFRLDRHEGITMKRFRLFWEVYGEFARRASKLMDPSSARGYPHCADYAEFDQLRQLSTTFEVLERIHSVSTTINELVRIRDNANDACIPDDVQAGQWHKSLIQLWNEDEEVKKKSDLEELILYLLKCISTQRYRKRGETVYEEWKIDHAGVRVGTRAWVPAKLHSDRGEEEKHTIKTMILRFLRKEPTYCMWSKYINLRNKRELFQYFEECEEVEFPFLVQNRNLLSFRNGILNTAAGEMGEFYPWVTAHKYVPTSAVAAKYFDAVVDKAWWAQASAVEQGWWHIPTPGLQSILDYQNLGAKIAIEGKSGSEVGLHGAVEGALNRIKTELHDNVEDAVYDARRQPESCLPGHLDRVAAFTEDLLRQIAVLKASVQAGVDAQAGKGEESAERVYSLPGNTGNALPREAQVWVYVFLGRLLHELGAFDAWQIIPFFKGAAGTGKSTIAHIAKHFFDVADVGFLSSNAEKKFGLQSLLGKLIFLCLELKKNIQLDPSEFQSMVSAEEVSVARKNRGAIAKRWTTPGLLCGNEAPGWVDAQGSISRRMAVINFTFRISDGDSDPDLLDRTLREELAAIIVKSNIAYRDMAGRSSGVDIWKLLPKYFRDEKRSMQRDTDPLCGAIWDENMYELFSRDGIEGETRDQYYVLFDAFDADYRRRHRDLLGNSYPPALTRDRYSGPFGEAGLTIEPNTHTPAQVYKLVDGVMREDRFLVGIRLRRASGPSPVTSLSDARI
jgi:hypothetical protein